MGFNIPHKTYIHKTRIWGFGLTTLPCYAAPVVDPFTIENIIVEVPAQLSVKTQQQPSPDSGVEKIGQIRGWDLKMTKVKVTIHNVGFNVFEGLNKHSLGYPFPLKT